MGRQIKKLKKTFKSSLPKSETLYYKAVKSILQKVKTIKTFLIRKYLRKFKEIPESENNNKKIKLQNTLNNLKNLKIENVERTVQKLFGGKFAENENELNDNDNDNDSIIKEIISHKLFQTEIELWKTKIEEAKISKNSKTKTKTKEEKESIKTLKTKAASIHPLNLKKKDRITALFMDCLAEDDNEEEEEDDDEGNESEQQSEKQEKTKQMKKIKQNNKNNKRTNRQPLRQTLRQENNNNNQRNKTLDQTQQQRRRPPPPELDIYKPLNERNISTNQTPSTSPSPLNRERNTHSQSSSSYSISYQNNNYNHNHKNNYSKPFNSFQSSFSMKSNNPSPVSVQSQSNKLHPSWEAKKRLKEKSGSISEGVGLLPSQGKKIVFED